MSYAWQRGGKKRGRYSKYAYSRIFDGKWRRWTRERMGYGTRRAIKKARRRLERYKGRVNYDES